MTVQATAARLAPSPVGAAAAARPEGGRLRRLAIAAGIACAVLFVIGGVGFHLALYGDGSIFSYAVAVESAWTFHFHNIPSRLFVYLFCSLPAEIAVHLTGNAAAGIALYGTLLFGAQLCGLALTWAADRSPGRVVFVFACGSTAGLCPFVFGFPTEMWIAHALFWPTLALCHDAGRSRRQAALAFAALLALALTHEGALVLEGAILATVALRGSDDPAVRRSVIAFLLVVPIWAVIRRVFVPDPYIVDVMHRAAFDLVEPRHLAESPLCLLLAVALTAYGVLMLAGRALGMRRPQAAALVLVLAGLAVFWLRFDHALHTQNRYYFRTLLLLALPPLGGLAAAYALRAEGRLRVPMLRPLLSALERPPAQRALAGAFLLLLTVHAVETAKFVAAWGRYEAALRALATGTASDPALGDPDVGDPDLGDPDLGDPRFVSATRIDARLDRLAWASTTPFLSVLLAPGFAPTRLVVDPRAGYFWLPCARAAASEAATRVIPEATRRLVRVHACLHR